MAGGEGRWRGAGQNKRGLDVTGLWGYAGATHS